VYLYPCCASCSQAGPVNEETAGGFQKNDSVVYLYPCCASFSQAGPVTEELQVPDIVSIDSAEYLYPCCASCSQAGTVIEESAGSRQCKYCTCIPAVLVAARLVQLLKKLQVPARKVHPRQSGPYIYRSLTERGKSFSFSAVGRFSSVFHYFLDARKMYISLAAFGIIFRITSGFRNSCLEP
jgi:hypothetical protein